jgi:3-deoxy-D-manno-octulosonic-acid transferase
MKSQDALQQRLALWLYGLAMLLLSPILWGALLWRGLRQRSYWHRLTQRLGCIEAKPDAWGGILVHAASLGEVLAASPLMDELLKRYPARMLTISCQTPTGLAQVEQLWKGQIRSVYLPIDTPFACQRFLDRLQPRLVILLERELWPNLLRECRTRVIPVGLVNARLSQRSARLSRRLAWLIQPMMQQLTFIHAADQPSAERLIESGAKPEAVSLGGNLKFDIETQAAWREERVRSLGAIHHRPLLLLASSHEGEERQVLEQWPKFLRVHPDALLILVPRHPHRFEQVAKLIDQHQLRTVRRSTQDPIASTHQVLLVDVMGELQQWYRLATICAVAGSWAEVGGHNALEALLVGKPVLFGPHTHNFETLYAEIEQSGAGERVANVALLIQRALDWLNDQTQLKLRSQAALTWVQSHQGSAQRAISQISPHLPSVLPVTQEIREGRVTIWQRPELSNGEHLPWLPQLVDTTAKNAHSIREGRGQVKLVRHGETQLLLRHAHRGGLIGKMLGDRFLRAPAYRSRSLKEFYLLNLLQAWALPVPTAVAARHEAGSVFDRCDLMMVYVPDAPSLFATLQQRALTPDQWECLGGLIARFHAYQINHVDLNCHNILLPDMLSAQTTHFAPILIDFDKCRLQASQHWKTSNLDRLLRSLKKEKRLHANLQWQETDWKSLMQGYTGA